MEILGGISAGFLLFVAFTPIGWVALLAVGVATAAISYSAGKGARKFYNSLISCIIDF